MNKGIFFQEVEAEELFSRFDKLEGAIKELSQSKNEPQQTETSDLLTRKEVAKYLKVSLVTLHFWTRRGLLKAHKLGNKVYYNKTEVNEVLKGKEGVV